MVYDWDVQSDSDSSIEAAETAQWVDEAVAAVLAAQQAAGAAAVAVLLEAQMLPPDRVAQYNAAQEGAAADLDMAGAGARGEGAGRSARYTERHGIRAWRDDPTDSAYWKHFVSREGGATTDFRGAFHIPETTYHMILRDLRLCSEAWVRTCLRPTCVLGLGLGFSARSPPRPLQVCDDLPKPGVARRAGAPSTPLGLRVMLCLKYLASRQRFDAALFVAGISKQTLSRFFTPWVGWMRRTYGAGWITPGTEAQVAADREVFRRVGLPGCQSSMDGVHINFGRCPHGRRHEFTGNKGKCVIFNVHSTHSTRITSISPPQAGSRNDQTTVRYDPFVDLVVNSPAYTALAFALSDRDGAVVNHAGAWILCDGGYHAWPQTINPYKYSLYLEHRVWSEHLESVRKVRANRLLRAL